MRKTSALAFSLLGLFASVYLWWVYTSPSVPMICMGDGCETVRASRYAYIHGVPLPAFGVLMYTTLVLAMLTEPLVNARLGAWLRRGIVVVSGAGFLASLYLTALEAFVIHAYCEWCVVQAISVTLVLAFSWGARSGYDDNGAALRGARRQFAVLLIAILAGVPALLFMQQRKKAAPPALPVLSEQTIAEHMIRSDSHVLGSADAPVTVVEFGDLQCPSCIAAHRVNQELRKRFGTQMRLVFRQFPIPELHPYALKAAEASECAADQGKFWEAVDRFYQSEGKLDVDSLRRCASELGLDVKRFNSCLDSGAMAARVRRDVEDARFLGVRSTPTFVVGRQMIEGALNSERFTQLVNDELARNSALPATGGAPVQIADGPRPAENKPVPQVKAGAAERVAPSAPAPRVASAPTPAASPASATGLGPAAPVAGLSGFSSSASPFTMLQGSGGCDTNATPVPESAMIHTREARELHRSKSLFIDVRSQDEFGKARISGAINVPMGAVEQRMKDLPRDRTIVLYESGRGSGDDSCALSRSAARTLLARGFQKVKVYKEGLAGWEKEGLPLQR